MLRSVVLTDNEIVQRNLSFVTFFWLGQKLQSIVIRNTFDILNEFNFLWNEQTFPSIPAQRLNYYRNDIMHHPKLDDLMTRSVYIIPN